MRKPECPFTLVLLIVGTSILAGCSSSYMKDTADTAEGEAGPVEFERMVELEKAVHFLSPNEEDVVVNPGTYSVEAVESTLRLTPTGVEGAQPVILQAKPTTHERREIDVPEPFSIWPGKDMRVVMLLMPNGKAMQAVGSYSGVHSRGSKKMDFSLLQLPIVQTILTTPKLGALTPGGMVYIKGRDFGTAKGKVMLHFTKPVKQKVALSVERWSATKITAKIPKNISRVIEHKAKLQVRNAKGIGGGAWSVPFYAAREGRKLSQ